MDRFDRIIIGAGPGGYVAAIRAAQLGAKVALVDKEPVLGGTCLRVGCIPSKALLEASERYHAARHGLGDFGVKIAPNAVELDLPTLLARKSRIVTELTEGIRLLMKKNAVTVLTGTGELRGDGVVRVTGAEGATDIAAEAIILATGSEPVELPSLPFDGVHIVSSTEALSFERVPTHLCVVGGGAIGLELGSVWARLGARVTVVELLPQIVPLADKQIVQLLSRALKKQGLEIRVQTRVEGASIDGDRVRVALRDKKDVASELECDKLLVAVGRRPFTNGLGLERVGIVPERGGRIAVDARFATAASGVYAIGDIVAGPMLAHKAEEEGVAVAEILAGRAGHVNPDTVPSVVYTSPEVAQVGITEDQAKERGLEVRIGKFFFKGNGRAKSLGEEEGMVKVVADAATDRLLGVHIVGPRASDLIGEAVLGMEFGASAEDIARTIHAHPTLSEAVKEAALAVDGRAIHG